MRMHLRKTNTKINDEWWTNNTNEICTEYKISLILKSFSLFWNFSSAHRTYVSFLEIDLENGNEKQRENTHFYSLNQTFENEGRNVRIV